MSEDIKQPVILSLEGGNAQPLSVRAKALVFADPVSAELLDYIERIAPSEAPVLIGGETGTGKELVARHIHHLSGRKGPFLAVNCGAISDQLAESELFGHEAGSFTGATGKREGWFEAANGGTLFLDEIGDLPLPLQVKLLRVLQEREVVRIGSRKTIPVDVRLVAATNVDLDHAVNAGHFRRDLLYRINIAHLRLPPLRERPGDIMPLANYFLRSYSQRMGYQQPVFSEQAIELMLKYAWPGNIRELENVIHFALLVSGEDTIKAEHLKVTGGWEELLGSRQSNVSSYSQASAPLSSTANETPLDIIAKQLRRLFEQGGDEVYFDNIESLIVHEAFNFSHHNQVHTAALLGISRNVMRTLLKRHGLLRDSSYEVSAHDVAEFSAAQRVG
ncbi:sigma-54 dependent transcriptional regulator [Cellvibrio sp. NN19]|uniref:sigma-54 interaction domain-containing protein n=1 Tax=Cellvibrio chitinivorans TaxID=3102792 RepID=UPI002B418535|nr:sigma-54 dependent transcriptional regulator [Cellvibrio sp. NN19]